METLPPASPGAADYLKQSEEARTRAAARKAAIEQQLRKGPSPLDGGASRAAIWRPAGAIVSPRRLQGAWAGWG